MPSVAVSLANPQALYQWITLVSIVICDSIIFSNTHAVFIEEEEWDPMEAVKIKYTPFEQEYTFKEVIAK